MSGIIKSNKSESQIAAKSPAKKKTLKTEEFQVDVQPKAADTNLEDVAIAVADAPIAKATQVFNDRYAEGLGKFFAHVQSTQQQTSSQMISQIYAHYGIEEDELYGAETPTIQD